MAPCAIQRFADAIAMSSDEELACTVASCVLGLAYEAGARVAVTVKVPLESGVTEVEASPESLLRMVQLVAPAHADNAAAGATVKRTLAPRTGAPLGSSTTTRTGFGD